MWSRDHRTLQNLLALEETTRVSDYFGTVQKDIQPCMRKMLAEWMMQNVAVVSRLDWCLASVVPSDFLQPLLHAIPFVHPGHLHTVYRHVHTYIALAATEYTFLVYLPSTIACASVGVTMGKLDFLNSSDTLMQHFLVIYLDSLRLCYVQLQKALELSFPPHHQAAGICSSGHLTEKTTLHPAVTDIPEDSLTPEATKPSTNLLPTSND